MHPDLDLLVRLWGHDERVDSARARAAALKADVGRIEEEIRSIGERMSDLAKELAHVGQQEAEASRTLGRYIERRDRAAVLLKGGQVLDYTAVQKQLDQCTALVDELESQVLEFMEQREEMVERGSALEAQQEEAKDAKGRAHERWVVDGRVIRSEIEAVWPLRQAAHDELNRELATKYDSFRARGMVPLAVMGDEACTQCHVVVHGQIRIEVNSGRRLHQCRGCGRWLVPAVDAEE
ncbi:MAG: hypothetical protein VX944_08655 [Myxococcota bacterium]|nr:hypothetical protein [Myxococcota bacterium]MEC9390131.1 hypothetical protein [Myxococcota bacterium]